MEQPGGICYIVGAMPLEEEYRFSPTVGDLVIAADGGYARLQSLGITPHLVAGDFDSLQGGVPDHPDILRLPRIKDETDMGYAINHALRSGYRRFVLLGGMGGRLEHTIANLQLLEHISREGGRGILAGGGQAATVLTCGSFSFPAGLSGFLSVFCLSGSARGVDLVGLKYPLEDEELTGDFPLGVSNEFLGGPATVRVREGSLLIIWQSQNRLLSDLDALLG